ncbi:E3 ubiquitin-protein ligase mind-bomb-like isoform X2 [Mizuhopecten yessoensis]|uniref:E3 ubiquitin-protein ligase mind-bomb-like isoform X2 n=1 Tax=Mizuhopecten yessoensis TaxID=6573 RepID=UPI000B45D3E4|nr:E3 ubiquitin-protein ligase mind-bomb-like isoform X2 [Mizuhopecten yessoensis]
MTQNLLRPGVRVVRGPDWRYEVNKKQDGGVGHTGTIVYVPKHNTTDRKVTVIWDSGREVRYRAGQDGKYDLRIFDSGPAGVIHEDIICDGEGCSSESKVKGLRWKCAVCHDFDLCTRCYMGQEHDLTHGFVRIDVVNSPAVAVPPRSKTKTVDSMGVFPGAKVVRGPHWKWKNQDGSDGDEGEVKEVVTWESSKPKGYRGAVKVFWKRTDFIGTYRLGGDGCVDILYKSMRSLGSGGPYYPDHLPVVDVVNPGVVALRPSDKVRVALGVGALKQLQEHQMYGGWDDQMVQCTKELGTIVEMLFEGKTVKVQYEDGKVWHLHRSALTRKHAFAKDEAVVILSNHNTVMGLQDGHGGWNDEMSETLGQTGRIVKIDNDGDMRIKIKGKNWLFSPVCVNLVEDVSIADEVPANEDDDYDSDSDDEFELGDSMNDVSEAIAKVFVEMLRAQSGTKTDTTFSINIVQAAAQGALSDVQAVLKKDPSQVDTTVEDKTALQLASYEGHKQVVQLLLQHKANKDKVDKEGDTALHYAAFGKEESTMEELLKAGAKINVTNKKGQTALHVAVGKGSPKCTQLLVNKGADVNVKDGDGDTVMHDCILQKLGQPNILQAVLKTTNGDYLRENGKGFNVLQWAVLKDNNPAVQLILGKNKRIVNLKTKDGYTPLHIAAVNNHADLINTLIRTGEADVNAKDKENRTPLHLAVLRCHKNATEILVNENCDVNAQDDNSNTALHLALGNSSLPQALVQQLGLAKQTSSEDVSEIICFLLEHQASITLKNSDAKTALDLTSDPMIRKFMERFQEKKSDSKRQSKKGTRFPAHWESMTTEHMRIILKSNGGGIIKMEYENVVKKFARSLPQARVLKVERVQSKFLWEVYYMTKRKLERQYGGFGTANERELFHGTIPDVIDVICKQNFDMRLAGGRIGTLLGKGTYFAAEAKTSDGYASPDGNRHKFMFLAKVLVGKSCVGNSDYSRPPSQDPSDPQAVLHDSCVDNTRDPRIYCVFDNNQYYPEYLIEYV